jgi:redox-sensitive bicupin YhaK (pirin superfamily)
MHSHKDDEILTYLRSGNIKHLDSEGYTDVISNQRLMMMNAGANFYHQEKVLEEGGTLEGLQIFIRPETAALSSQVQFFDLHDTYSVNRWRKIAGKGKDYPLQIRSDTWLMDLRLQRGQEIVLPQAPSDSCAFIFYVFDGKISVNDTVVLTTGESILSEMEDPTFRAVQTSDVMLLITQTSAAHFDGGMYSGNLHR